MASIEDIKKLRSETMASMIECRNALEEAGGDFGRAREILRKKGALVVKKKAEREIKEGIVDSYIHSNQRIGVLVDLGCETDFVAKNEEFKKLAHDIAMHIAAMDPHYIKSDDVPSSVLKEIEKVFEEEVADLNKPEHIKKEIIKGRFEKHIQEISLLTQPFIKDENKTIEDLINESIARLGENIQVRRFVRYQI